MTVTVRFSEPVQSWSGVTEMTVDAETFEQLIAGVCARTRLTPAMFARQDGRLGPMVICLDGGGIISGHYKRTLVGRVRPGKGVVIVAHI